MNRLSLLVALLVGCGGSDPGNQRELCQDVAATLCARAQSCDPEADRVACAEDATAACCREANCDGPPLLDDVESARCFAAIDRTSCSDLADRRLPGECEPAAEATLTTSWKLVARGFEFSCEAFSSPDVAIGIQGATTIPTATASCSAGTVVRPVPAGTYAVRGALRARGVEVRSANAQVTVDGAEAVALVFRFDEVALAGEFSDSFASAYCARCGASDPLGCPGLVRRWACQDAGTCDLPTAGLTSELARCRADVGAMACDAETIPDSCLAFRQILPGVVR
jgi:hypothetical protein